MKRAWVLAVLLLAAGFAGCLGGDGGSGGGDGGDAETASSSATDGNTTGEGTAQTSAADEATLAEPPSWSPGTWWKVEVQNSNTGETHTIKRVVGDASREGYRVGMPADAFSHPTLLAHFPGMGKIDPQTLGFSVHGEPFQPLSFPLEKGQTWSTSLYQQDLEAEVVSASDGVAEVEMTDGDGNVTLSLTYDADQRAITELSGPLGAGMQVVDHGQGYEGKVKVPENREQFIDGRAIGAFNFALEPAPPTGTVSVPNRFDGASFAQLVGSIPLGTPAQPGYYQETTTTPAGETTEASAAQASGGFTINYGSTDEAAGEWSFEHVAGGLGVAATEIIAYESSTVSLPTSANTTSAS